MVTLKNRFAVLEEMSEQEQGEMESLKSFKAVMTRQMSCCSCNVVPREAFVCKKGHIMCGVCKLLSCTLCGSSVDVSVVLTNLTQLFTHKCKFVGCTTNLYPNELMVHENMCVYSKVQCPSDSCDYSAASAQIFSHLSECQYIEQPPMLVKEGEYKTFTYSVPFESLDSKTCYPPRVLKFENGDWFILKLIFIKNCFMTTVLFGDLASNNQRKRYDVVIMLHNSNLKPTAHPHSEHIFRGGVLCIGEAEKKQSYMNGLVAFYHKDSIAFGGPVPYPVGSEPTYTNFSISVKIMASGGYYYI